jgi:hypothetical protein
VEKYGRVRRTTDDNIKCSMSDACWINKAIDTCLEYVIIIAIPEQLWLRERALLLLYTYIASLINPCNKKGSGA